MADFTFTVDVSGFEGVVDRLKDFPSRFQKRSARVAARKAMNIVRDAARERAKAIDDPDTKEQIWKNIVTNESQRGGKRIGGIKMRVGVMGGALAYRGRTSKGVVIKVRKSQANFNPANLPGGETRYWRHQEFGTINHKAQPMLLPALMNNAQRVTDRLANELVKELDKLAEQVGPLQP